MYRTMNPATGTVVEEFPSLTETEVESVLARSDEAYSGWRDLPIADRAHAVGRAATLFRERASDLADLMCLEVGKLPAEGAGEVGLTADIFAYYSAQAEDMLADEQLPLEGARGVIEKRPIGALVGIMPWNFPCYQVARFVAPNLILGNTIILKHAPSCPKTALAIEQLLHDAGVPKDAYINVFATNEQIATMIADPRVQGISLTGSERAGAAVAAVAGQHLKKVVLELGGSDPFIVLDATNVAELAATAAAARMGNAGQACNAPKRMIVMSELYDDFVAELTTRVGALKVGDPAQEDTTLAPLSSPEAADRLASQLDKAIQQGAVVRTGGSRVDSPGAFIEPTVLTDVTPEMDAYREELFGPVAVVYRVTSEDEAVRLANDTPFGLGAAVFSDDPERALAIGRRLDVGMVYVNAPEGSQADLPFGGTKRSGLGRELGALGVEEFMNKRIVRI